MSERPKTTKATQHFEANATAVWPGRGEVKLSEGASLHQTETNLKLLRTFNTRLSYVQEGSWRKPTGCTDCSLSLKQKQQRWKLLWSDFNWFWSNLAICPWKGSRTCGVRSDRAFITRAKDTQALWAAQHRELGGEGAGRGLLCCRTWVSIGALFGQLGALRPQNLHVAAPRCNQTAAAMAAGPR